MEQKIKIGLRCVYAAIAINFAAALFQAIRIFQSLRSVDADGAMDWWAVTRTFGIYEVIVAVLGIYFADMLRKGDAWGWVGSSLILLITVPSFAFPVSVIGLLNLLDSRVRDAYIEKLDIKLT